MLAVGPGNCPILSGFCRVQIEGGIDIPGMAQIDWEHSRNLITIRRLNFEIRNYVPEIPALLGISMKFAVLPPVFCLGIHLPNSRTVSLGFARAGLAFTSGCKVGVF